MPKSAFPSPFYRVSAKALVFDGDKLLAVKNKEGGWEVPGGGWEHDESMEACITRELKEEIGAEVTSIGEVELTWRDYSSDRGVYYLRLGVPVERASFDLTPNGEDDLTELDEVRFVDKAEFLALPFENAEEGVKAWADKVWSLAS